MALCCLENLYGHPFTDLFFMIDWSDNGGDGVLFRRAPAAIPRSPPVRTAATRVAGVGPLLRWSVDFDKDNGFIQDFGFQVRELSGRGGQFPSHGQKSRWGLQQVVTIRCPKKIQGISKAFGFLQMTNISPFSCCGPLSQCFVPQEQVAPPLSAELASSEVGSQNYGIK